MGHFVSQTGPFTSAASAEWLSYAIETLGAIGAPPPRSSRLYAALDLLKRYDADPSIALASAKNRRLIVDAHRASLEFSDLAQSLAPSASRLPKDLIAKLHLSYGDGPDPLVSPATDTAGRNYQFELWVGAWLAACGRPVRPEGADLAAPIWFEVRGFAAKRVRSFAQLGKRVRRAASQIAEHHRSGFTAISVDTTGPLRLRRLPKNRPNHPYFTRIPGLLTAEEYLRMRAPWVRGAIWFGWHTQWTLSRRPPRLLITRPIRVKMFDRHDGEDQHLRECLDEMLAAVGTPVAT